MTIQVLKEFGSYLGFDEISKCWVYKHNERVYEISKNGVKEI